ncbi:MAG: electron transfer flavoprotein subunit beta/FixA family protein [Saprospiraceae bacterium]|nr:electron transfer flavoprotein subunit beta/FixA family protein [Saprospiraceae bacterium]
MKLLVCISKTPDTTSKINFDSSGQNFIDNGVQYIMNPYDEWYALVRAIELKEQFGGTVEVIHIGDAQSEMIIRKALAIGADSAIRVDYIAADSMDTATQIANVVKSKSYDMIFLGKETIDHNGSEVGGLLAGILDWPFIAYVNKLSVQNTQATIESEIEGGIRISQCNLPMVISCAKGLAEQRIPNMMGIMNAKKKPLEIVQPIAFESKLKINRFELPAAKSGVRMISPENINELVDVLKNDLKII